MKDTNIMINTTDCVSPDIYKSIRDAMREQQNRLSAMLMPRQVGKSSITSKDLIEAAKKVNGWDSISLNSPGGKVFSQTYHCDWVDEFHSDLTKTWNQEYMSKEQINIPPHSERTSETAYGSKNMYVNGKGLNGEYTVEDECVTLVIKVPGVEPTDLEITRVDRTLRVRVKSAGQEFDPVSQSYNLRELEFILADYETVKDTKLALGVLTITIDRERDIQHYDVG